MKIPLPHSKPENSVSLEAALIQRETTREYLDTPLSLANLSCLLLAAQGRRGSGNKLLSPSAHERYPLSVLVAANRVTDISTGLYRYENSDHNMVRLGQKPLSEKMAEAAIGEQPWVRDAAAIIILAGNIQAMNEHFSEQPPVNMRGERYNYIEVGAAAQNVHLQATALSLGMVLVGGFDNQQVKVTLGLRQELEPCALLCIGNV